LSRRGLRENYESEGMEPRERGNGGQGTIFSKPAVKEGGGKTPETSDFREKRTVPGE